MKTRTNVSDQPFTQKSKKTRVDGVQSLNKSGEAEDTPWLGGVRIQESITIGRSAEDLYTYWRRLENLPHFCKNLQSVEVLDSTRSRWTANGPGDKPLRWEATILEDVPNERISWRSLAEAEFENAGSVRFKKAPGGRGTEVQWTMTYNPPAGPLGSLIAKLTATDPAMLLKDQLHRFKQLMETGEIPTTDGQPTVIEA